jgi:hypothetical protein
MPIVFDERLKRVRPNSKNDRVFFFKYVTVEAARAILSTRSLRWSTPGTLNDPYDVQFDLAIHVDNGRVRARTLDKMWAVYTGAAERPVLYRTGILLRLIGQTGERLGRAEFDETFGPTVDEGLTRMRQVLPETNAELRRHMATSKLLCLTVDPTNPAMWVHYAQQNRGVVLCVRSIPAFDSPYVVAQAINYVENLPALLDEEFLSDLSAGHQRLEAAAIMDRLVFTKGAVWSTEQEWRVYSGDGRNAQAPFEDIPFHPLELAAVIFGIQTSDETKGEIRALCTAYPNVELLQAVRSDAGFKHEIVAG